MKRRDLLRKTARQGARFLAGVALIALACDDDGEGGGGGGGQGGSSAGACANGTRANIGDNHGHALVVPAADVLAGASRSYDIRGSSGHAHTVRLDEGHMATLQRGGNVTVQSSSGGGHTHSVNVRCA